MALYFWRTASVRIRSMFAHPSTFYQGNSNTVTLLLAHTASPVAFDNGVDNSRSRNDTVGKLVHL